MVNDFLDSNGGGAGMPVARILAGTGARVAQRAWSEGQKRRQVRRLRRRHPYTWGLDHDGNGRSRG
jgi:hypothetical protein